MKRNIIHTLWMAAALSLTACSQEDFPMPDTGDALPLAITVSDGGFNGTSRAAEDGYRTEFTAGDECGLYIVRNGNMIYENVKFTAAASGDTLVWQPQTGVTDAGVLPGEQYFLYYPYQADMTGKVNATATTDTDFFAPLVSGWRPKPDQSAYAAYTASDLMTAQGTASKRTDGMLLLSFAMSHRMALAVIEMPRTVYKFTDTSIPDCTVATAVDFTDGNIQPYALSPGNYRCIVNPASGSTSSIKGSYADGKKEFAITPSASQGSYKTYKIDGAPQSEKQTTLQMGDYFCKDRDNNWYIIPQEATPDGNVIGIVFYAGLHETDQADYSQPLTENGPTIPDGVFHGYVVALTDVHDGSSDRLRWEWGPNQQYDQSVNTSTSTSDWQGYSNSLKFHEFVKNEDNKEAGWEMKHFPASLACETYGNRTSDPNGEPADGKYDWQKSLAAPSNTSGWFLPSCGQLLHLYANRSLLSARMTDVKNSTSANCNYRDKIKWFSIILYYWSSTENSQNLQNSAWSVRFYGGYTYNDHKYRTFGVRAVLTF